MNVINRINNVAANSMIFKLVIIAVIADTVFGILRAIKQRSFNSCIGIDGAIRKIAMIFSLGFCIATDVVVHINLIGFLPKSLLQYLEAVNMNHVGLMDFFGIIFIAYEVVSILKNMTLCGLPVKQVYEAFRKFLTKYTNELPEEGDDANGNKKDSAN